MFSQLHCIYGKIDPQVAAFYFPSTTRIDVFLRSLRDDRITVIVEPIDKRSDSRMVLIFNDRRIVEGPDQSASAGKHRKQTLIVDVKTNCFDRAVKVWSVNKERGSSRFHLF